MQDAGSRLDVDNDLVVGHRGEGTLTVTDGGIVEIDGTRLDVVSDGELIEPGTPVEVTRVDGNRIVVRQTTNTNQKEDA